MSRWRLEGRRRHAAVVIAIAMIFVVGVLAAGAVAGGMPLSTLVAGTTTDGAASTSTSSDATTTDQTTDATTTTEATTTDTTTTSTSETSTDLTTTEATTNATTTAPTTTTAPATGNPSVASDQPDYAPGDLVTLTGSGWQSGETIHISVDDDQGRSWQKDVNRTADPNGSFTYAFNLPTTFAALYTVTATGSSGAVATTTFTDGNVRVKLAGGPTSALISWEQFNNTTCSAPNAGTGQARRWTTAAARPSPESPPPNRSKMTAPLIAGYTFASWSNDISSTSNPVCVAGSNNTQQITANYTPTVAINTTIAASNTSAVYGAASVTLNATVTPASCDPR